MLIAKSRELVERHVALVDELGPQHIFELGALHGGSTLFFAEIARPRRIVAVDRAPKHLTVAPVESDVASRGLSDVVRFYGEVDQADRRRLAEIVEEVFDGSALDLVIDDCSHLYEPTRASFNELFPRLRPGGAYVIEDWPWAHIPLGRWSADPDQVPLTRLLFEIILAMPGVPDLITDVSIDDGLAVIRRGDASVDPATFDVSACSNPRGRALLANLTDREARAREQRLRRTARRQGKALRKSRRRDPRSADYGKWWITDASGRNTIELADLDRVEQALAKHQ